MIVLRTSSVDPAVIIASSNPARTQYCICRTSTLNLSPCENPSVYARFLLRGSRDSTDFSILICVEHQCSRTTQYQHIGPIKEPEDL